MSILITETSNFRTQPLFWLAVCFAAGILFASVISAGWIIYLAAAIGLSIGVILLKDRRIAETLLFLAFITAGGLHFSVTERIPEQIQLKYLFDSGVLTSGDPIEIEGILIKQPEAVVDGSFLFAAAERIVYKGNSIRVSGNVRFFTPLSTPVVESEYKTLDLQYGVKIITACELKREDNYLNHGVASRKQILDQQGIDAFCTVKSPLLIEKLAAPRTADPLGAIFRIRQTIIGEFRGLFDAKTSGVLIASLLGNKNFLDKQTAEVFREGGTFHVLVISGLHITFIGGLLLLVLRFVTRNRYIHFAAACAILWSYSLAVGAEIPVVRASLMFTILLFPFLINRHGSLLNSLGASVLVLLVWRPEDVFSQSFQLTFVSVTAIISTAFPLIEKLRSIGNWVPTVEVPFPPNVSEFVKRSCETIYWREKVWEKDLSRQVWTAKLFKLPFYPHLFKTGFQNLVRYLFEGIVVSFVVQISLLPLLIVNFNRISFFSVLLNLWVGINIAVESFTAVFALLLSQIDSALAGPFVELTGFLNRALLFIPQILIDYDLASARIPVYSGQFRSIYFVFFAPLVVIAFVLNRWNPFQKASNTGSFFTRRAFVYLNLFAIAALAIIQVFHPYSAPPANGSLKFEFLDVGQGDSTLITFPNGETMLVDGGGRINFSKFSATDGEDRSDIPFEPDTQSIGESVVSKFLWEKGYSRVDYLIATHADTDHIQGLSDVANNFAVKKLFVGRTPFDNEEFLRLYNVAKRKRIAMEIIGSGDTLEIGGAKIEVLFPDREDSTGAISDNNNSVVLMISFKSRKFLLTGDIEKRTEGILAAGRSIQADVVKVAHHGSRTSSIPEFVSATGASYAIIPVGQRSGFGHPHLEVVERWQRSGARVMTTGERGTVSISTNGSNLRIDTFQKGQ